MALTITAKETLKQLFSKMVNVVYIPTANLSSPALEAGTCIEFPILEESATYKEGEVTTTKVKLTDGQLWDVIPKTGDDDMGFQIGTINDTILSLFHTKMDAVSAAAFNGFTYAGNGYKKDSKILTGGLFLTNEDKTAAIWMPSIKAYGSVALENNKPAYINVKYDALNSTSTGAGAIYYLTGTKTV